MRRHAFRFHLARAHARMAHAFLRQGRPGHRHERRPLLHRYGHSASLGGQRPCAHALSGRAHRRRHVPLPFSGLARAYAHPARRGCMGGRPHQRGHALLRVRVQPTLRPEDPGAHAAHTAFGQDRRALSRERARRSRRQGPSRRASARHMLCHARRPGLEREARHARLSSVGAYAPPRGCRALVHSRARRGLLRGPRRLHRRARPMLAR